MAQPTTVHKSAFGLLFISFIGLLFTAVLIFAALSSGIQDRQPQGVIYAIGAVLVVLVTFIQAYVYLQSFVEFDSDSMRVVYYSSLFVSRSSDTLYRDIEDVQILQPGIFGAVFGYDTLTVETAGTVPNLKLTFIPNGERWAAYLLHQAQLARTPVSP